MPTATTDRQPSGANRVRGELRGRFRRAGGRTEVASLYETGGYRLRLPRSAGPTCEAVIVNTGGGVAGGDHVAVSLLAEPGSVAAVTTTAAEKIYRAEEAPADVVVTLSAEAGADLAWLPQETILFDGARLLRRIEADVASDATLLIGEALVFGRLAMGEVFARGLLHDRWRVRRDGRLVFAEELRLDRDIAATLHRPALGDGARAAATVLLVAPDAETRLAAVRDALAGTGCTAGASAWDGLVVVRALSASPARLRGLMLRVLALLGGRPLPRSWQ